MGVDHHFKKVVWGKDSYLALSKKPDRGSADPPVRGPPCPRTPLSADPPVRGPPCPWTPLSVDPPVQS